MCIVFEPAAVSKQMLSKICSRTHQLSSSYSITSRLGRVMTAALSSKVYASPADAVKDIPSGATLYSFPSYYYSSY